VLGRSRQPWWRRAIRRPVPHRLIDEARDFDVHFISDSDGAARP
jgi:K+-sensing histidine kinase KdpD